MQITITPFNVENRLFQNKKCYTKQYLRCSSYLFYIMIKY